MKPALRFLALAVLLFSFTGFASSPAFIVRFFVETNAQDTERFSAPVQLKFPPRQVYIERVPIISERDIKGVYPFRATDGSWGCAFQLDPSGRLRLYTVSTEQRGRAIVAFVGTKRGTHQVIDMVIDRPISDGVISVQRGLTIGEIEMLGKKFPVLGGRGRTKIEARKPDGRVSEPAPEVRAPESMPAMSPPN